MLAVRPLLANRTTPAHLFDRADSTTIRSSNHSPMPDPNAYWARNLRYLTILLAIWFAVSFGCGILFADALNAIRIPGTGFKLGFWFAQQGSRPRNGLSTVVRSSVPLIWLDRFIQRWASSAVPDPPATNGKEVSRVCGR